MLRMKLDRSIGNEVERDEKIKTLLEKIDVMKETEGSYKREVRNKEDEVGKVKH
jgi:hypothetical protein